MGEQMTMARDFSPSMLGEISSAMLRDPRTPLTVRLAGYIRLCDSPYEFDLRPQQYATMEMFREVTQAEEHDIRWYLGALDMVERTSGRQTYWEPRHWDRFDYNARNEHLLNQFHLAWTNKREYERRLQAFEEGVHSSVRDIAKSLGGSSVSTAVKYIDENNLIKHIDGKYYRRLSPDEIDYANVRGPSISSDDLRVFIAANPTATSRQLSKHFGRSLNTISRALASAGIRRIPGGGYYCEADPATDGGLNNGT